LDIVRISSIICFHYNTTDYEEKDSMKLLTIKTVFVFFTVFLMIFSTAELDPANRQEQEQKLQHEAIAINIEVPVRVFQRDKFIDNLSLEDFELYEDGKLQKIEAVYLIKKKSIEKEESERDKEEARKIYRPEVSRYFVFVFAMFEYLLKINEILDYFFDEVYIPGDTLNIATPIKTYNLNPKTIAEHVPSQIIKDRMKLILRRDIHVASGTYQTLMRDLESFALESDAENYMRTLRELQQFRYVDLNIMEGFANYLKAKEGQKHVFLLYQQENIPLIGDFSNVTSAEVEIYDPTIPEGLNVASQSYITDLLQSVTFDTEKLKNLFADSSISAHFLFVTKPLIDNIDFERQGSKKGLRHRDITEDVYNAFMSIAKDTGGLIESSANVASAFQKAAFASENYYLLYYSPKDYKADGKFRKIRVKVKGKNYAVNHRAGYIAD
jgi:VWFA-related protein